MQINKCIKIYTGYIWKYVGIYFHIVHGPAAPSVVRCWNYRVNIYGRLLNMACYTVIYLVTVVKKQTLTN